MKYQLIEDNRSNYPVEKMCNTLKASRSSYYSWRKGKLSKRQEEDKELLKEIRELHQKNRQKYGSPRMTEALKQKGYRVSEKRVARLMKENDIVVKKRKSWVRTTDSNHNSPIAPNILSRNFDVMKPNTAWVSDITYVPSSQGWLYLCVILDLYSRKVVGWNLRSDMTTELVMEAFEMACVNRKPEKGVIFHSDRGVQYASNAFRGALKDKGFIQSMSRRGNCWDNAPSEAFFARFKEESCDKVFEDYWEARITIFEYIECYYNRTRLHSTLGYLSPEVFEQKNVA
jgi:transposase InsO family protein